jgi:hypothetical protein
MVSATVRLTGPLDSRENFDNAACPIAGAIDVVGARSAFLLLREAFYGTSRSRRPGCGNWSTTGCWPVSRTRSQASGPGCSTG